jgi:uncharacterized membrane protein
MSEPERWSDEQVEQVLGNLLRVGVLLSAAVVLLGGALYLIRHGGEAVNYHDFTPVSSEYSSSSGIMRATLDGRGRGLIQFGLLILIATPVCRVILSALAFFRQRDYIYVVITLIVLAILLYSLLSGQLA